MHDKQNLDTSIGKLKTAVLAKADTQHKKTW